MPMKELSDGYLRTLNGPKAQADLFEGKTDKNGKPIVQVDIFDTTCRNLSVRVNKNYKTIDAKGDEVEVDGKIVFNFNYTFGGKRARFPMGEYSPKFLGDQARTKVLGELRPMVAAGKDPRLEAKRAKDPATVTAATMTMRMLGAAYVADCRERGVSDPDQIEDMWEKYVNANVGDVLVREFRKQHRKIIISAVFKSGRERDERLGIEDGMGGGSQANKMHTFLSAAFNYCVKNIDDVIEVSPIAGMGKPTKDRTGDRYLDEDEIKVVWFLLATLLSGNRHMANILKLMLITGQRLEEVCAMKKSEVNLRRREWIHGGKNGLKVLIPLSDLAMSIIVPLHEAANGVWMFPGKSGKGHVKRSSITKRIFALQKAFGLAPWTPHDLRRTFSTTVSMQRYGIANREYKEHVLHHISETHAGVKKNYDLNDFADEKRTLLDAWGAWLERVLFGGDNVVRLGDQRAA